MRRRKVRLLLKVPLSPLSLGWSLDFEVVPFQPGHQLTNRICANCSSKTARGDILQTTQRHKTCSASDFATCSTCQRDCDASMTHEVTRTHPRKTSIESVAHARTHRFTSSRKNRLEAYTVDDGMFGSVLHREHVRCLKRTASLSL